MYNLKMAIIKRRNI